MIAVSYLQPTGSTAELRYLVRRLRQHAPGARVVVGLWDPEGTAEAARAVGADREVGSLRDGVAAILEELRVGPAAAAA